MFRLLVSVCVALMFFGGAYVSAQGGPIKTSFTLQSAVLNEERAFEVYVPTGRGPFETVYVLDGQAHFAAVVGALAHSGQAEKIVVGLGNIWLRDRDYTPTRVAPSTFVSPAAAAVSGGGRRFIAHVAQELIPYVTTHFPANGSRTIIGHSLGGLIAAEILMKHPGLFNRFVIIDPSMWWDDADLVKQSSGLLKGPLGDARLFVAIAAPKNKDRADLDAVRKDATDNAALIRPSVVWLDVLASVPPDRIQVQWKYYSDRDHMSVVQAALPEGLRFVFR